MISVLNLTLKKTSGALKVLPFVIVLFSCQKESSQENANALSPLASRGKGIYLANCIACHNPDPKIDGSIGPAVAFSSLEVLTAKILTRTYPPGYTSKRSSAIMPDFPQLKEDIPALHAYLNSFKK